VNIVLDPRARLLDDGRTLVGGDPWRVLRLSESGAAVVRGLLRGVDGGPGDGGGPAGGDGPAGDGGLAGGGPTGGDDGSADAGGPARALARRLIDAGLAHPRAAGARCGQVTVVIPVRDRAVPLDRCLRTLVAAETPGRLIVVDDGSRDAAAVRAVCDRAGCELIRREHAGGPAAARNLALEIVDSGMVALLDSDCVPEPGWLGALCGVLAADPGLGAVAPRVRPLAKVARSPASADRWELSSSSDRKRFPAGTLARFAEVRSPLDLGPWPSLVRPGGRTAYVPTAALLARRSARPRRRSIRRFATGRTSTSCGG
jgi:mycofactocin glycosyltransferase